jgi:hypothetical protein
MLTGPPDELGPFRPVCTLTGREATAHARLSPVQVHHRRRPGRVQIVPTVVHDRSASASSPTIASCPTVVCEVSAQRSPQRRGRASSRP